MLSKRERKFLGLALAASSGSTYNRVKIGAVLVKSNRVISSAANLCTSHPLQKGYNIRTGRKAPQHNLHAEMHALVRAKLQYTEGSELFIGRFDRLGSLAMCRPCPACEAALKDRGIVRVTYTSPYGILTEEYS